MPKKKRNIPWRNESETRELVSILGHMTHLLPACLGNGEVILDESDSIRMARLENFFRHETDFFNIGLLSPQALLELLMALDELNN